jgi:hypothetical protein
MVLAPVSSSSTQALVGRNNRALPFLRSLAGSRAPGIERAVDATVGHERGG